VGIAISASPGTVVAGVRGDKDTSEANAAFIVTACNAHDELVAALQRLIARADDADKGAVEWLPDGHAVPPWSSDLETEIRFARAALAKVQP
jgi:hypothetical protein